MSVIVLAMHGAPPKDFPHDELVELFGLHTRMERAAGAEWDALARRYHNLDAKIRAWPRTPQNDPFHSASYEMAAHLSQATGLEVIVGFNEFCAPDLDEALEQAVAQEAGKIVVITPMMTRGGEHAEQDIPAAIRCVQEQHPDVLIHYVWPFETAEIAKFFARQIAHFI